MEPRIVIDREAVATFCRQWHVARLSLFGSVLREDFGPDSDVDVLVEFLPGAEIGLFELSRMAEHLESLFRRKVDLVPLRALRPSLQPAVLPAAQQIYVAA